MQPLADPLDWLPALLQTTDAFFPTGAYAHSLGFEEFARLTSLNDESALRQFVEEHLLPTLETLELPYLRFAYDAATASELAALGALDHEISAWKLARETREASVQIGRRRLAALRAVNDAPLYRDYALAIRDGAACGHHITICAMQAVGESIPLSAALAAWFYQSITGVCGAALKLIRIGQEGCQRVIRHSLSRASVSIAASQAVAREEAGSFDPMLEIASMRHEFSDERLFIS